MSEKIIATCQLLLGWDCGELRPIYIYMYSRSLLGILLVIKNILIKKRCYFFFCFLFIGCKLTLINKKSIYFSKINFYIGKYFRIDTKKTKLKKCIVPN